MPIYKYRCLDCGKEQEIFFKSFDDSFIECSTCKSKNLKRLPPDNVFSINSEANKDVCCGLSTPCSAPKHCCGK